MDSRKKSQVKKQMFREGNKVIIRRRRDAARESEAERKVCDKTGSRKWPNKRPRARDRN